MFCKKFGFAVAAAIMLTACGNNSFSSIADKNSDAAKKEEAQIAINSGNYSAAIAILRAACPDNASGVPTCPTAALSQQLASAYMGQAGLDVLTLVKTLDQANSGTNTKVDFANISTSLNMTNAASAGATDIAAANAANAANLVAIDSAIQVLSALPNPTADQQLQLGMAQASAAVIAIGSVTGGYDANGIPAICNTNCATSSGAVTAALNQSVTTSTGTTSVAAYTGTQLINSSSNINASVGGNTSNNSTAQQTNDLTSNVQNGTCTGSASSTYTPPAALSSTQVTTYVTTCLH